MAGIVNLGGWRKARNLPFHVIHVKCGSSGIEDFPAMLKVTAAEFQKHIGRYQDLALTQPVAVTRNGRERTVLLSVDEYQRLKRRDRQVMELDDFTEADVAAVEAARAPEATKALDTELAE
jgi:prevent-host-death family protein